MTSNASTTAAPPALAAIHHVGITVTDLSRSLAWYADVLGMIQWGEEKYPGGRTALIMRPGTHVHLGLDAHDSNAGEPFAPHRTGLDHLSLMVTSREELVAWQRWLVGRHVDCGEITDVALEGIGASLISFKDPDGVALELIWMAP